MTYFQGLCELTRGKDNIPIYSYNFVQLFYSIHILRDHGCLHPKTQHPWLGLLHLDNPGSGCSNDSRVTGAHGATWDIEIPPKEFQTMAHEDIEDAWMNRYEPINASGLPSQGPTTSHNLQPKDGRFMSFHFWLSCSEGWPREETWDLRRISVP